MPSRVEKRSIANGCCPGAWPPPCAHTATPSRCAELPKRASAAAQILDNLTQRDAHRHLDQTSVVDLAGQREHLGASALLCANSCKPVGTITDDWRDVGEGLDVINQRRVAPQAAFGRVGRARAGRAAPAFDRGHQRSLFAADKRARADADVNFEVERRLEDLATQQAELLGLPNRDLQAPNGKRILAAHIGVALVGADSIGGDRHPFEDTMRVALKHATIHKRARVALVAIAHDKLPLSDGFGHGSPL